MELHLHFIIQIDFFYFILLFFGWAIYIAQFLSPSSTCASDWFSLFLSCLHTHPFFWTHNKMVKAFDELWLESRVGHFLHFVHTFSHEKFRSWGRKIDGNADTWPEHVAEGLENLPLNWEFRLWAWEYQYSKSGILN